MQIRYCCTVYCSWTTLAAFLLGFFVKYIMMRKFHAAESDKKREAYPWEERMSKRNKCQVIDVSDHAKPLENMESLSGGREVLSIRLYWPLSVSIILWTGILPPELLYEQYFSSFRFLLNIPLFKKFLFLSTSLYRIFHSFSILNGHTLFLYISLVLYILLFREWLQIFTYEKMTNECAVLCKFLKPAFTT